MHQLSLFDSVHEEGSHTDFPLTHDDVLQFLNQYVYEGEKADDLFSWNETSGGKSYFIYNVKVFEHIPGDMKTARLRILIDKKTVTRSPANFTNDEVIAYFTSLKDEKKRLFRSIVPEVFACCNDYVACSDALACIHSDDRFYNGCQYRKNLESGRVFYGKNKNIEGGS